MILAALMCLKIKPFTTTQWNTFLKSVDIRKGKQTYVAKAFLLDSGDTLQNEMTTTKHKREPYLRQLSTRAGCKVATGSRCCYLRCLSEVNYRR